MRKFEKIKGFLAGITFALVMTIFTNPALAENIEVLFNRINIKINNGDFASIGQSYTLANGTSVPFSISHKGTTYIPLRRMGELYGKDVVWDGNTSTAMINDKGYIQPAPVPPLSSTTPVPILTPESTQNSTAILYSKNTTGSIKGTITWKYNDFLGHRGDTGACILLLPTNLSKDSDKKNLIISYQPSPQGENGVYGTIVDGNGSYIIDNVPVGEYYLLIMSDNATRNVLEPLNDVNQLKNIFNDKDYEGFTIMLTVYKHQLKTINILKDQTITESVDFGYTYF